MHLYYGGCEQGTWRTLLYDSGVRHMSLSFMGLRRRVKRLDRWRLADKFPPDVRVFLDSGAFTLNKEGSSISVAEASEIRESYLQFVSANIHDIEFASEFDANVLGHASVFSTRESFWATLPGRKWMPVWHADYGTSNLVAMADDYDRLGVLQSDSGGDLTPVLNRIAAQTQLHGVAMTRMDAMREVRWASVGSTSWLSPSQYGDTIVWSGRELHRYPRKQKDTARKRHRTWLRSQGFDTDAIEADDSTELLRVSVWSWQKYIDSINGVTTPPETPPDADGEPGRPAVAVPFPSARNGTGDLPGAAVEPARPRTLLPVVGFSFEKVRDHDESGHMVERDEPRMTTPAASLLRCDTCFMKDKCPASTPGSDCLYEIPVQIRTPAQRMALQDSLVEMQTQRVLRMTMIEQTEGGYADPNLSAEMSRLWKMTGDAAEGKDTFKLTVEAGGSHASAGVISRIFGSEAGDRLTAAEPARSVQDVVDAAAIFDAEVVDE
jgi:hypothetical protein